MHKTLGDLSNVGIVSIRTGPFGSALHAHEYQVSGVPVIPAEAMAGGRVQQDKLVFISEEKADELDRYKLMYGDLVFARRGAQACGVSAFIEREYEGSVLGTGIIALRVHDTSTVDPRYLSYFVGSPSSVSWLKHHAIGATMPNLNSNIILSLPVRLPSIEDQKGVVRFIKSIDDRIELNRQINTTLESMAQALFKSWFVDFDPVIDNALAAGNPIPDALQARADKRAGLHVWTSDEDARRASATEGASQKRKALHHQTGRTDQAAPLQPLPAEIRALFPDSFIFNEEMGWMPEGWEVRSLGEVTSKFATGLNPRKNFVLGEGDNYYVTIKDMQDNEVVLSDKCDRVTDEAIGKINARADLRAGDSLFSAIGTIGRVAYIDKEPKNWNTSESIFSIRADHSTMPPVFLYRLLLSDSLQNYAQQHASGSVQKGIRMSAMKEYRFILASPAVLKHADTVFSGFLKKWKSSNRESLTLKKLRDTLLPRLLSGQI